jgi:lipopolysaccharide transport system permease protein
LNAVRQEWTVYGGDAGRRSLAAGLRNALAGLRAGLPLGWQLFRRDFAAKYRESYLGYVWAFLPSIVLALTMTLAGRAAILNTEGLSVPYPLLVLVGVSLWQTFAEAVVGPVQALNQAKPLLAKIRFPHEAMLVAKLGEVGFNALLRLGLIGLAIAYYGTPVTAALPLGLVGLLTLVALGTAIGLFLAPIGGLYSDVSQALTLGMGLWMFLTPVVYERARPGSVVDVVNRFNPATPPVVFARESFLGQDWSNPVGFLALTGASLGLLLAGWLFWRFGMRFAVERAGS